MSRYVIPDDPEFTQRGDPMPYGKKKGGKLTKLDASNRSKDYRKYAVGTPLSLQVSGASSGKKPRGYTIVEPHATRKGTVYIRKGTVYIKRKTPPKITIVSETVHNRGFDTLKKALEYTNNIAGKNINPREFQKTDNQLTYYSDIKNIPRKRLKSISVKITFEPGNKKGDYVTRIVTTQENKKR